MIVSVVPIGGFLFEYFLLTCSGYSVYRELQACIKDCEGAQLPVDKQEKWLTALSGKFTGWLLFHVASVGSNGRNQMFYMTFVNQYFGLSRQGISCLSRYGYATPLTRFDEMRQRCRSHSERDTRYEHFFHLHTCVFHNPHAQFGVLFLSCSFCCAVLLPQLFCLHKYFDVRM